MSERVDEMLKQLGLPDDEMRSLPARFALGVLVPQLLFYLGLRSGGLVAALVIAGGWTVGLQLYDLARRREWDPFLEYGLLFTLVQGAVALSTRSPAIYAGGGVVENLIGSAVLLGSVVLCRPLLVEVLSAVIGAQAVLTLPVRAALRRLTVLWAVLFLARSVGLYVADAPDDRTVPGHQHRGRMAPQRRGRAAEPALRSDPDPPGVLG